MARHLAGEFVPELIHNRSGVGSMIQTADLNKDGAVDIMAATSRGGHIFWNRRAAVGDVRLRYRRRRSEDPDAGLTASLKTPTPQSQGALEGPDLGARSSDRAEFFPAAPS